MVLGFFVQILFCLRVEWGYMYLKIIGWNLTVLKIFLVKYKNIRIFIWFSYRISFFFRSFRTWLRRWFFHSTKGKKVCISNIMVNMWFLISLKKTEWDKINFLPVQVATPGKHLFKHVVCGSDGTFLITVNGRVLAAGSNEHNKLGFNSETSGLRKSKVQVGAIHFITFYFNDLTKMNLYIYI